MDMRVLSYHTRLFLTSAMLAVFSFKALLALLNADPRVQYKLRSLEVVERELVHVPYRPAQAVHGAHTHGRDAISAFREMKSGIKRRGENKRKPEW